MTKKATHADKKRHGAHRNQNKHFMKVYWPYLPGALLLVATISLWWFLPGKPGQVEAYATNISGTGLLSATNEQRTKNGVTALKASSKLSSAAQAKAKDMAKRNYWSHTTPDGKDPWVFIQKAGYDYRKAGENLAYGFSNNTSTVAGWMNSATHKANLLDKTYSEVGFGFINVADFVNQGPETIVVAMYGAPAEASEPVIRQEQQEQEVKKEVESEQSALNSASDIIEPPSRRIALVETITNGETPWALFAVGIVSGGASSTLLLRHGLKLRKLLRKGEKLVLHHPIIDTALILIIIAGIVLSKSVGFVR